MKLLAGQWPCTARGVIVGFTATHVLKRQSALRRILGGAITMIHFIKLWSVSVCLLKIPNDKLGNTCKEILLLTEVWGLFWGKAVVQLFEMWVKIAPFCYEIFFAWKDWQNIFIQTWVMGLLHLFFKKYLNFFFNFTQTKWTVFVFLLLAVFQVSGAHIIIILTSICNFCFDILPSCCVRKKAELGSVLKLNQFFLHKWLVGWMSFWS